MTITYRWPKDEDYILNHYDPLTLRGYAVYRMGRDGFAAGAERYPGPGNPAVTRELEDLQTHLEKGRISERTAYLGSRDIVNAWVLGWDEACADSYKVKMEIKRVGDAG